MSVKRNSLLTLNQKKNIVDYCASQTKLKFTEITEHFSAKFEFTILWKIIKYTWKNREKINNSIHEGLSGKRFHVAKFSKFEEINKKILSWIDSIEEAGVSYTDQDIKHKACSIANESRIIGFEASNGWLHSFKTKYEIKRRSPHGESYNINEINFNNYISQTNELISQYGPKNVFNCDETALCFKSLPTKTNCQRLRNGWINFKDRVTLLLCSNMNGCEKLKPVFIHKYATPRSLKGVNVSLYVDYKFNSSAWMTGILFNEWLKDLDEQMLSQDRQILLILDNVPSHHNLNYIPKNIRLRFLPPNSTSKTQPLDAGIIRSFKARFLRLQLAYALRQFEITNKNAYQTFKSMNIYNAIHWCAEAWFSVSSETIRNCWKKCQYSNDYTEKNEQVNEDKDIEETTRLMNELQFLDKVDKVNSFIDIIPSFNHTITDFFVGSKSSDDISITKLKKKTHNSNAMAVEKKTEQLYIEDKTHGIFLLNNLENFLNRNKMPPQSVNFFLKGIRDYIQNDEKGDENTILDENLMFIG